MKNSAQREWIAKTIEDAKAVGVQVRWHSKTIVVLGTTDDGDECEKDHQPLHGETRQEGRSEDRPEQGA